MYKPLQLRTVAEASFDFPSAELIYCDIEKYNDEEVQALEEKYKKALSLLQEMGEENTSYEERHQKCRDFVSKEYGKPWEAIIK